MSTVREELKKIKETKDDLEEIATGEKAGALQKALLVGVGVFFFAIVLFVAIVIVLAKLADKLSPPS
ncbi:MAG: hypothetical protein ABIG66_01900 [Candidatus Kerfeldbacteria bacterium]